MTDDGLSEVFVVNVLAPYALTALMDRPDRTVIVSSGIHLGQQPDLDDLQWERRRWDGWGPYSESKLWDVVLALARLWPGVLANAVDPGWVLATRARRPRSPAATCTTGNSSRRIPRPPTRRAGRPSWPPAPSCRE